LALNGIGLPDVFALHANYPNPFNPVTTIGYTLSEEATINITVYDITGKIVNNLVNNYKSSGYNSIQWNATNDKGAPVSAGLYLYTIQAGEFRQTRKMVLLK
jgi:flagellar hook assembly protein FlgD